MSAWTVPGHSGLAGLRVSGIVNREAWVQTRCPRADGEMPPESAWESLPGWVLGEDWAIFSSPVAFQSFQHQPTTFFSWEVGL